MRHRLLRGMLRWLRGLRGLLRWQRGLLLGLLRVMLCGLLQGMLRGMLRGLRGLRGLLRGQSKTSDSQRW